MQPLIRPESLRLRRETEPPDELESALRGAILGEVRFDAGSRALYATTGCRRMPQDGCGDDVPQLHGDQRGDALDDSGWRAHPPRGGSSGEGELLGRSMPHLAVTLMPIASIATGATLALLLHRPSA